MGETIDMTTVTHDGITYQVRIEPDHATSDLDDLSQETRDAYERGEWRWVGVIVGAVIDGWPVGPPESLWGVAYGTAPDWEHGENLTRIVGIYPVPELIGEVNASLRNIRDALRWASLD